MQKSLTWILLGAACAVFALILVLERNVPGTKEREQPAPLVTEFNPRDADAIRITLPSGETLQAKKTNDSWELRNPAYPAQESVIANFLTNLASIRKQDRMPAHEVALQGAAAFGLEPGRGVVEVASGTNRIRFQIGGQTPLTNHVYLRMQPSGDVVVASAEAAKLAPESVLGWRDPRVVNLAALRFDHLRVRNGPRTLELGLDRTNDLWRIARPIPARANQARMAGLLDLLRHSTVSGYIADAPADLERYGLQAPALELAVLAGTNQLYEIEFGGPVTNNPHLVYARLIGGSNVVAVSRQLADFLNQPYKNFQEAQLVNFKPSALSRVVVASTEQFELMRQPGGGWIGKHNGDEIQVDRLLLSRFFTNVLALEILDLAKEVPTEVDLQNFGLLKPRVSLSFYERDENGAGAGTNLLLTELTFGTNFTERVLARRSDEVPVYLVPLGQLLVLPDEAFELRDRRIWSIPSTNITRVSLSNAAGTNSLTRAANGTWSDDPILNEAISEAVLRLSTLEAVEWVSKGEQRKPALGISANPLVLTIEAGDKTRRVEFGTATVQRNVYAAVNLPDQSEPVLFQFPGLQFYSLIQLLPVPQ